MGRGNCSVPMLKWWSDRSVCAPQYRSAATSIGPMLSVSVRVFDIGFCTPFALHGAFPAAFRQIYQEAGTSPDANACVISYG